jgi:hypothetical protein
MAIKKTLKIGRSDFELIVKNGHYFVDKTMLIYDLYTNANDIILMPRPKRFGKTLNLSMIEHFFDILKPDSKLLFSNFEIAGKQKFCEEHQNKYPIINISLKSIKESGWEKCLYKFKTIVSGLYKKNNFLLLSDKIDEDDKQFFKSIIYKKANETDFKIALVNLSRYLQKHFNQKVVILVDEYDTPIINAFNNTNNPIKSKDKENKTYYEKVINFMQGFLGDAYKGNDDNLQKGLLTGVMRVGKESIFSEWNNFKVFDITSTYFSDKFGFTKEETKKILAYYDLDKYEDSIQKWYDGYKFGNVDNIYNPWSVVNFIEYSNDGFKPYWVNSGDYSLIKNRIIEIGVKDKIKELIEGKTIDKELKDNFVFQDFETDNEMLWTLLTDNGYLTQVKKSKYGNYKLKIPNNEVKIVFTDIIMSWLNIEVKIKRELLISTAEDLINNRINEFEKGFKQIIGDTLSYFDIAKKTDNKSKEKIVIYEQIYHVYTLGLLAILSDDYMIKSNRESGEGRYDIALIPHNLNNNGVVIEIKSIKNQKENETDINFRKRINKEIDDALKQIERKKYYKDLIEYKIRLDKILRVPIIFAGKEPFINKI